MEFKYKPIQMQNINAEQYSIDSEYCKPMSQNTDAHQRPIQMQNIPYMEGYILIYEQICRDQHKCREGLKHIFKYKCRPI